VIADGLEWRQHRPPQQQQQQQQTPPQQQRQQQRFIRDDRKAPLLQTEWSTISPASSICEQPQQRRRTSPTMASRVSKWLGDCTWPGVGLFCESYLLLAVGALVSLWEQLFPNCFNGKECAPRVLTTIPYSIVLGLLCGMILVGCRANRVGRRLASIFTASLMAIGSTGVWWSSFSLVHDGNVEYMYKCMNVYLFLYGMGVGGEYPLSAAWACETAMQQQQSRETSRSKAELDPPAQVQPQPTTVDIIKSSGSPPSSTTPLQRLLSDPSKEDSYSSD
jgi:Sugar (and other) transporter